MTPPARTSLNYALIRSRAAETGLTEHIFTHLVGVHLDDLKDLDQRAVSLTLLTRLSRVLGLTLDQLVIVEDEPAPPTAASPAHADLLLALLLAYGSLGVEQLLDLVDWTHHQLAAAAAAAEAVLAPTPLRLVITDQQITCVLRPGSLPSGVQTRAEDSARTSQPLQAHEIGMALSLIPNEILAPFQNRPKSHPASSLTDLADRGLAVAITPCADNPEQATARPHPDLMFALRLTGTPHPGDPVGSVGSVAFEQTGSQ
ncbi:MAG: hypothetical protein ACRDNZ_15015 [Streptosporangiaceae bacterium]